jgi:hypothetical protein
MNSSARRTLETEGKTRTLKAHDFTARRKTPSFESPEHRRWIFQRGSKPHMIGENSPVRLRQGFAIKDHKYNKHEEICRLKSVLFSFARRNRPAILAWKMVCVLL